MMAGITIFVQLNSNTEKLISAKPLIERLAFAPATLTFYLRRTFVPNKLSFEYPYPPDGSTVYLAGSAVLILVLTIAVVIDRKRFPSLFFGWGWFVVCWLPVSGLVYVGTSFTTDRYTYLPHIGLFFGIVYWITSLIAPANAQSTERLSLIHI